MVASELFSDADRALVREAVTEAEKRTAGEIVPVVATASDDYERAEDTFGLWLALALVSTAWLLRQGVGPSSEAWSNRLDVTLGLIPVLALIVGGWIAGIQLARRIPVLKRAAASRAAMRARVLDAAERAFDRFHVRGTSGATGIVLYVSLFERIVCVRGDRGISEKIGEAEWREICDALTQALRAGKAREGFVEAVRRAGDLLARHVPPRAGDVDELKNDLRLLD